MQLLPTAVDRAIDAWVKVISYAPELRFTAWLAWFFSISLILAILFAVYYFGFVKRDFKFTWKLVISSAVVALAVEVLKRVFVRARPDGSDLFSFPSRHTALAFLLAFLVILQNPKDKSRYLLLLWACLVGFSRLWLEQHYLTDVVVGAVIGIVFAVFALNYWDFGKNKKLKRN
ncbi:MAG TPA: phosphatase PAP2 family protein [Nanoarchaeota archaeon]|nr:phosphatase PAP2 family protein [Nanoarchaeota archaeon]